MSQGIGLLQISLSLNTLYRIQKSKDNSKNAYFADFLL